MSILTCANHTHVSVGVDVSKATLEMALNDKQGSEQFPDDEAGIAALLARLRDAMKIA